MATADQIRATAETAIAGGSNILAAAPGNSPVAPSASTSDVLVPAPSISLEQRIEQLQLQLAQALGVIAVLKPAAVAAVAGERTYYSHAPFVKIHVMRGVGQCEAFQFKGGKLTTDDPGAIAFMEATIAAGDTNFSRAPIPKAPTAEELEMQADVREKAVIARDKMVKAGEAVA